MRRTVPVLLLSLMVALLPSVGAHGYWLFDDEGEFYLHEADPTDCRELTSCKELEGVILKDYHVADELDEAEALFAEDGITDHWIDAEIYDSGLLRSYTSWRLCQYDVNQTLTGCTTSLKHTLTVTLSEETAWVRIIMIDGYYAHWWFTLTAHHTH